MSYCESLTCVVLLSEVRSCGWQFLVAVKRVVLRFAIIFHQIRAKRAHCHRNIVSLVFFTVNCVQRALLMSEHGILLMYLGHASDATQTTSTRPMAMHGIPVNLRGFAGIRMYLTEHANVNRE